MKKEKFYYIVSHTISEYSSSNVAIRDTFEEAKEVIKNIADWYGEKGSGKITEYNENFESTQYWNLRDNEVFYHMDYRKYREDLKKRC